MIKQFKCLRIFLLSTWEALPIHCWVKPTKYITLDSQEYYPFRMIKHSLNLQTVFFCVNSYLFHTCPEIFLFTSPVLSRATYNDHFVRRLSVRMCLSNSHAHFTIKDTAYDICVPQTLWFHIIFFLIFLSFTEIYYQGQGYFFVKLSFLIHT